MEQPTYPGLQIEEDMAAIRRSWRMQRIGWALLALFVLAGVLGLLGGGGPLQQGSMASADGSVRVHYPRIARYVAPVELTLEIAASAVPGDSLELAVSHQWLDVFEMYGISPQPESQRMAGEDLVLRFATTPGQPLRIGFFGRPHHVGRLPGGVQVADGERLSFSTFVMP